MAAAWTAVIAVCVGARTMSAPEKVEPTQEVLLQSWQWRHLAYKHLQFDQCFQWRDAWDVLLDALLEEHPEWAWTGVSVSAS